MSKFWQKHNCFKLQCFKEKNWGRRKTKYLEHLECREIIWFSLLPLLCFNKVVFFYYYGQRIWVQHYSYLYDYDYSPEFLLFCFSSFYLQRERIHPIKCLQCQCNKTNTTKRLKQVWGKGFNRIHMNICSREITKHNLWHKAL